MVVGGSGSGKTRFYAKPNIMQANTSFVVLDPKGEILRDTGNLLQAKGYDIKVLDLINMHLSHCYNPFTYLQDDKDVLKLVTNLIRNTTPKGSNTNDPFWERSETALLEALMLYLLYEAPPEEQNFPMVMEMIAAAEVREDDENYQSPLDELFETGYGLIQDNKIECLKVGRAYRIPKPFLLGYLKIGVGGDNEQ